MAGGEEWLSEERFEEYAAETERECRAEYDRWLRERLEENK